MHTVLFGRYGKAGIRNPEPEPEPVTEPETETEPEPEHSFQLDWVWDDALIIQNIFAFASRSRQHRGIGNKFIINKFLAA